ncbi:MAG: TonB-dependent receptor plug domain-containing protein, partial [Rhodothermaceae bacterium]|nr:TonB-dependent receptor plug domain-containing protein [Rhodothermaceae bacterium]
MILKVAFCLGSIVGGLFAGRTVQAQVPNDTLSHYELGEIVVGPQGSSTEASSVSTTQRVRLADIAQTDVASIDYVLRLVPSAHLQTNSRGESLIYLRGSGERQVSIFFDGALLNVPWDNRIDLSLIPSEVVGEISIAKGVPSVLYGANVLGGAINLTSRQLSNQGTFTQLSGITGSYGSQQARLTWLRRTERFQTTVFAGLSDQNGIGVPDEADLPYSQHSDVRTNTDRRMQSLFGQVAYNVGGGGSIGISLLSLGGKKGVAPEGHLDPEVSRVRFWRYPEWETNMAIVSGQFPIR